MFSNWSRGYWNDSSSYLSFLQEKLDLHHEWFPVPLAAEDIRATWKRSLFYLVWWSLNDQPHNLTTEAQGNKLIGDIKVELSCKLSLGQ